MKRPRLRSSARKLLAGVVEVGYRMKDIHLVGLRKCSWVDYNSGVTDSILVDSGI